MKTKYLEIRDAMTFIPVLAIEISGSDHYLARRAGYGDSHIVLLRIDGDLQAQYDPFKWKGGARTLPEAHRYIKQQWQYIREGEVIDVEFLLGETTGRKLSESLDTGEGIES